MWYNAFNKPTKITKNVQDINLFYGADIMRYKQVRVVDGETITTWYIGKHFEIEKRDSFTNYRQFISDVAIVDLYDTRVPQIAFTHKDRLGSTVTMTDENNTLTSMRHFDPFGKPRGGDWALIDPPQFPFNIADNRPDIRRGFTDHEHLDEAELIHMNGRVYDYNVGRFMSVDPLIHSEGGSQGINPYSYIFNNPLSGTDPTGYEPEEIKFKVKRSGSRIKSTVKAKVSVSNGTADIELTTGSTDSHKAVASAIGKTANKINNTVDIGGQQEINSINGASARTENITTPTTNTEDSQTSAANTNKKGKTTSKTNSNLTLIAHEQGMPAVYASQHPSQMSEADLKVLKTIKDTLFMTHGALLKSGNKEVLEDWDNSTFIFDPSHPVFSSRPDVAAFRLPNKTSTKIHVGRALQEFRNDGRKFNYHGATFKGGDSALLFVGLHEFGHIYGRVRTHGMTLVEKELFANDFTKKHYPKSVKGYKARRRDVRFAK